MLTEKEQQEILESFGTTGHASKEYAIQNQILSNDSNIKNILDSAYGKVKLRKTVIRDAILILSQPKTLIAFSSFEIRCSICKKPISYPAWYYAIKLAINSIHYFICFDSSSPNKPTTACENRS